MKIVSDKNKKIRLRSKDIPFPLEANIINLGREMLQYLKNSQDDTFLKAHPEVRSGVGLAAPQIGHNIRMFAVLFTFKDESYEYVLINPKIIKESLQKTYLQDGESCLSVAQDHEGYIYRAHHITIVGYDLLTSTEVKLELNGYPAIVFQHEYDHLNGVLFYDRINKNDPFKKLPNAIAISFDTDSETETGK